MQTDELDPFGLVRPDLARPTRALQSITARPVVSGDERTTTSLIRSSSVRAVAG
jgi:hypothetical protein